MYSWNAPEDLVAHASREAVLAGEKARLQFEIEEAGFDAERESIRRRLARTLVQLGVRLDPGVADDSEDDA